MVLYNGLTLAYIGDAAYELLVRQYLLGRGDTKVEQLHTKAIRFTSAEGQANAYSRRSASEIRVEGRGYRNELAGGCTRA